MNNPHLPECTSVGNPAHDTEEWHALRAAGIGSSDAGAILHCSPHSTPNDIWRAKTGERVDKPWLAPYAQFGTFFEPYLRRHLEQEFGSTIIPGDELGTLRWNKWPIAQANIDGLDADTGVIEELKTTSKEWSELRADYHAQVQHQMMVTGATEARVHAFICPIDRLMFPSLLEAFRSLTPDSNAADDALAAWLLQHGSVQTFVVEREPSFIAELERREREFWNHVTGKIPLPERERDGQAYLTDSVEVATALREYALVHAEYESSAKAIEKRRKAAKKAARKAIAQAVSFYVTPPKKIVCGDHKATYIDKGKYGYWRIYPAEVVDDVEI